MGSLLLFYTTCLFNKTVPEGQHYDTGNFASDKRTS